MLCGHSHCQQYVPFFASSICEHLCILCEGGLIPGLCSILELQLVLVLSVSLGPVHTGRRAPCNTCRQIMEHTTVNRSVHTACKQNQRVCTQICMQMSFRVLCERAPTSARVCVQDPNHMWHVWRSNGKLVTSREHDDLRIWCGTHVTLPSQNTTANTSRNSLCGSALQGQKTQDSLSTKRSSCVWSCS